MKNDLTQVLKGELEKLGAREFEVVALTMIPDRGLAALNFALSKGVDHPIAYAITVFDNPDWQPSGEKPRHATNVHAPATDCLTCNGDRFVLVGFRSAKQSSWMHERAIEIPAGEGIEEWTPCPDCSSVDTSFRRFDGSMSRALDPAKVREMLAG